MRKLIPLVAILVLALTGCGQVVEGDPGASASAARFRASRDGAVVVGSAGDGAPAITIVLDFQCPACQRFESKYGPDITRYVSGGRLQVTYRPVSILDVPSIGRDFSSRGAAALFRVSEASSSDAMIMAFITEMFRQQPPEFGETVTNAQIGRIAAGVGVEDDVVQDISSHQLTAEDKHRTADNEKRLHVFFVPAVFDGSGDLIDTSDPSWLTRLVGTR